MGVQTIFPAEGTFLGREPITREQRITIKMSDESIPTVAFTPACLLHFNPVSERNPKPLSEAVEKITIYAPVTLDLVEEMTSDIKDHFETRLQNDLSLFFQVHKTSLVYREYETQHQVGQAKESDSQFAGAHSCTFPNLVCQRKDQATSEHMFAYESSSYMNRNATTIVPKLANDVDSALEPTMRRYGIQILNKLSKGSNLNPIQAFKEYLAAMQERLEQLLKEKLDPISQKIINDYLSVVSLYILRLNNPGSDKVVKTLTFTCEEELKVDDELYRVVQSQINTPLTEEMAKLEDKYKRLMNDETTLTGKSLYYFRLCFFSQDVQTVVRDYFETVTKETYESDMKKARDPKLSVTKVKEKEIVFSEKMRTVFDTCIQAIRLFGDNKGIDPRGLSILFPRVLKEIQSSPLPEQLFPFPEVVKPVTRAQTAGAQLALQVPDAEPVEFNDKDLGLKDITLDHFRICTKSARVLQVAREYFGTVPTAIQEADMKNASNKKLTVKKVNKVDFSPKMLALFNTCIEAIRSESPSAKKKAASPNGKNKLYSPKKLYDLFPKILDRLKAITMPKVNVATG